MPPPSIITVADIGMNTITVSWTNSNSDPNNVCGPVMYKVTISGPGVNNTDITNTKMNTFTGLTPNTEYTITITPFNDAGDGLSDVVVVMTMPTGKDLVLCTFCSHSWGSDFMILYDLNFGNLKMESNLDGGAELIIIQHGTVVLHSMRFALKMSPETSLTIPSQQPDNIGIIECLLSNLKCF